MDRPHTFVPGNPVYIPTDLIYAPGAWNAGGLGTALPEKIPQAFYGKVLTQPAPNGPALSAYHAGVYIGPAPGLANWTAPNVGIYTGNTQVSGDEC